MSDQLFLNLGQGAALRDGGTAKVVSRSEEWANKATRVIIRLAATGILFTSEDVVDEVGLPPHPNATGGVFLRASKRGLIVWSGQLQKAKRDARHASMLRVWRGK